MTAIVTPYKPTKEVTAYVKRIRHTWQSAFKSIIESGKILKEAQAKLGRKEWLNMVNHDLPFSRRTAEKLVKIASDRRITNPTNAKYLPPRWTSLHEITLLTDEQFKEGIKSGTIHAEAERKDISALVTPTLAKPVVKRRAQPSAQPSTPVLSSADLSQLAFAQEDQRRPAESVSTRVVVAEIATEQELTPEAAEMLEAALEQFCARHGLVVQLSGNLKKAALIKDLEQRLHRKVNDLRWEARDNDLTLINDAFYQLETGKHFPENRDGTFKRNDLRHPDNEFSDFDKPQLYGYCQDLQLLTQYTPIDFLDFEALVQMLMWRFLTGNERQKTESRNTLQSLASVPGVGRELVQKALKLLDA